MSAAQEEVPVLKSALKASQTIPDKVQKKVKKPPINRSKLGPDYVAPDGGWGWFVAIAAGCSNVSTK